MGTETTARPTRSDRVDLWTVIVLAAIVAVVTVVHAVTRIAAVLPNTGVEVLAPFFDTRAALPIGPNGSLVDVSVDQAVLTVSGMPAIVVTSLVLAVVIETLTTLTLVACGLWLCRNLMAGRAFTRTNTRLLITSSMVLVLGTAVGMLFETMGINGAFATLSEKTYDNAVGFVDFVPYFAASGLAVIALAFKAGERLQRETEGLV